MKVCYDGRVLAHRQFTGVERFARELLENFRKVVDVEVKIPQHNSRLLQHLWEHIILPLKCEEADFLISPANVGPVMIPKNCKYILVVHDVAYIKFPEAYTGLFRWYYSKIIPLAMKRADIVVTVSHSEQKNIVETYPFVQDKIRVIYPGLDNKLITASVLPFEKREPYFLYVGSLNPRKNLRGLLEAYKIFREKYNKKVILKVVGAPHAVFREVNMEPDAYDANIEYLGYLPENALYEVYRKALAFVFPSFYEGFGYPPLEAMSFGTPAIVSFRTSLPEVTQGKAVYVNPDNPDDIAYKMAKVVSDKNYWEKLSVEGKKVVEFYTWRRTVDELVKVMKLLNSKQ